MTSSLRGSTRNSLDDKFRLTLNKRFVDGFGGAEAQVVITVGLDGCLWVMKPADFDAYVAGLAGNPLEQTADRRRLCRRVLGHSEVTGIDKGGRLLIPDGLRSALGLGESREVMCVGMDHYLELWAFSAYTVERDRPVRTSSLESQQVVTTAG